MIAVCLMILLSPAKSDVGIVNRIPKSGLPPPARILHGSAYSSTTLVIFGGQDENNYLLGDL